MHATMRPLHRCLLTVLALLLCLSTPATAFFGLFQKDDESPAASSEAQGSSQVPVALDLELFTYQDIPCTAEFQVSGGTAAGTQTEGEEETGSGSTAGTADFTFAVVQAPTRGTVAITGSQFVYTPDPGKAGKDSFTYTAEDAAGQVSSPATVKITIRKSHSGVSYADTADSPAAPAAQALAECGVFVGTKIGDRYYFEPDRVLTRGEFLAMAMETMGLTADAATMTGFCDDASIPAWSRDYAASGLADGVTLGVPTSEGVAFQGDRAISGEEAAVMLNRILAVSDVDLEALGESSAVSAWAAQAVGNLETVSVLEAGSFGSGVPDTVTRGEAAQMLSAALTLVEQREGGFLDWLKGQ